MPVLEIIGGGLAGAAVYKAGETVGGWLLNRDNVKVSAPRRGRPNRVIVSEASPMNAAAVLAFRHQAAEKRRLEWAAQKEAEKRATTDGQGSDVAVLDAAAKTIVPMVRATTFASPAAAGPLCPDLANRLGLGEIRQMVFARVWHLTHHRHNPAPDGYDTAYSFATNDQEAFQQLLVLAGVDEKLAKLLRLTYEWVGDPLTLIEKLEQHRFGRFEATTGEILLPLTPSVRRQILGH